MKTKIKNPIDFKEENYHDFGDPFLFRYKGKYYLFHTGANPKSKVPTFESENLIDFHYVGEASQDETMLGGYAPEIIYCYNKFYLCTSPLGKGHYIYVSDNVTGLYKRLTDNIHSMIDGSFVVDEFGKLHFIRANHYGICMMDMDENGNLSNRQIIDVDMNGWTEGPSIIYKNGYYFLFYTGNNFRTNGYRVCYAYSKNLKGPYVEGINNPLIISDDKVHTCFGHSSEVLSPDLLSYLICFHEMGTNTKEQVKRNVCLERLNFNGALVTVSPNFSEHELYSKPTYDSNEFGFIEKEGRFEVIKSLGAHFVLEITLKNGDEAKYSIRNGRNYKVLSIKDNHLIFNKVNNETIKELLDIKTHFDFSKEHTIRIEKTNNSHELFIDNVPICNFELDMRGKLNLNRRDIYISFTNLNFKNKNKYTFNQYLPSQLSIFSVLGGTKEKYGDFDVINIKENEEVYFPYKSNKKDEYSISMFAEIKEDVSFVLNGKLFNIPYEKKEYDYSSYHLGTFLLLGSKTLNLKVLKGSLKIMFFDVFKERKYKEICGFVKKDDVFSVDSNKDNYYLSSLNDNGTVAVDIAIDKKVPYETFGILLNVRNYSLETNQCRYHFNGILVGITNNLIIVNQYTYNYKRVYDVGFPVEEGRTYHLEAVLKNGFVLVYVDQKLLIKAEIQTHYSKGRVGLYASSQSKVRFKNFKVKGGGI